MAHSSDDKDGMISQVDESVSSFESDIEDASLALDLFFNNQITECMNVLNRKCDHGLYHSLGASAARFMYSVLTFERADMNTASDTIKTAIEISNKKRKRSNLSDFFWGSNVNDYTSEEIHAELCYAENHIMSGFLTFTQDQSIFALIKAAYRIKVGNDTYKTCQDILNNRKSWESESIRQHFESGVCTGVGTANLILSHLPARALRVLKWAGFMGQRSEALKNLKRAAFITSGLRYKIVALITISYNLYMEQYYGLGKGDLQWSVELVEELHRQFPNGVLVLTFLGRIKQLAGKTEEAIQCLKNAIEVPIEWTSIRNICYWELIWCYSVQGKWAEAVDCAHILRSSSKWSRCVTTQVHASLIYMLMIDRKDESLRDQVNEKMSLIPKLRRKVGGKTIPLEKLALYISEKYYRQDESLSLPIYELFYFFNIFSHTGGRTEHLDPILARVQSEITRLQAEGDDKPKDIDNYVLMLLLKGVCLRYKRQFDGAIECFDEVIRLQDLVLKDTYIPPHAALELGIVYAEVGRLGEAKEWLEKAKNYRGFLVEVLVHLRIHAAMREIGDREKLDQPPKEVTHSFSDGAAAPVATESPKLDSSKSASFGTWIKSFV